ncbi:MAG: sigma-54 dependent transcriptional regulator [Deltaproteobacteria bacterium]|jgi:two-component system NtrC family response regulator|nr:sigma-54 dependent transcriptional regulator [Deltaproteobacteria bacterium]
MNEDIHVLILDDERNYLLVLQALLEDAGYKATCLGDPENALAFLEESEVDVLITDLKMPGISGQEVLARVKKNYPHIPVLVMTAFGSIESAVEMMRIGAFDYITKPFSNDELLLSVQNAAALARAHLRYRLLYENMRERFDRQRVIIGKSKGIQEVLSLVERAAPSRSNVLITGESGTGKELVARAIHLGSPRRNGPFISVNCAALNPNILESELFGHEKGSFTGAVAMRRGRFELADGGTLFLDEIGELSPDMQVKFLRVLQERKLERVGGNVEIAVDLRIVAATNRDLPREVEKQNFREDLYYRLNVVHIHLPPLRERREDIPLLVSRFVEKLAQEDQLPLKKFSPEALDCLIGYSWPGNIRELENVVERCLVMQRGEVIEPADLPGEMRDPADLSPVGEDEAAGIKNAADLLPAQLNLPAVLDRLEAALVRRALARADFVQVKAAELLGISKSLLQYKLRKHNIGH